MASPHLDLEAPMASIRDFWLGYGGEHRSGGDLTVFCSGLPDPQLNGVLRMRGGDLDEAIAVVTGQLAGVPWFWHARHLPGPARRPARPGRGRGRDDAADVPAAGPGDRAGGPAGPGHLRADRYGRARRMAAAALLAGRDRGLRTGILQATHDGEPVYRRMGFTTVGEYRLMQLPAGQSA